MSGTYHLVVIGLKALKTMRNPLP